ncbi:aspartic proteinase nepenthesin-1-like [Hordeum vulgare subsp. vulgare]|uniref:Peptidase A1 domain-containing protein n=1 Tax=Hordeum vulgare subsp. vulgare TaxID=112509 RepID=A0A8I6Y5D7_HORVV|nr:aspartic proteinase nepenthesin-1-like [Hordeum vulgare subsp. vulgare]
MAATAWSLVLVLVLLVDSSVEQNPKIVKWNAQIISTVHSFGYLIFDLSVGTPPQTLSLVLDITSQLVWAQCREQGLTLAPTFEPDRSLSPVGCDDSACQNLIPGYNCTVGGDEQYCKYRRGAMSGYLATETFSFGTTSVSGMAFGCSDNVTVWGLNGASGFAGFSRGALSLVSQLGVSRFSYFIARAGDNNADHNSYLSFGDVDAAPAMGNNSTPLLAAMKNQESHLYYVNLTGFQVDGELLAAVRAETFAVREDGSGGVFLSTTLAVTFIQESAYKVVRKELVSRIRSQGVAPVDETADDDLCFLTEEFHKVKVPSLALVLDGAGAAMELSVDNYFLVYGDEQTCLTILPSPTGRSVLGSLLQTGRTMTYDIHDDKGGRLTFEPVVADAPAPADAGATVVLLAHPLVVITFTATLVAWVVVF